MGKNQTVYDDIRIIDGQGNEALRIPNGGYLQLTYLYHDFSYLVPCRYVDDQHILFGKKKMSLKELSAYVDSPDWVIESEAEPQGDKAEWWIGEDREGVLRLQACDSGYDYELTINESSDGGQIDRPEWSMLQCRTNILMAGFMECKWLIRSRENGASKRHRYSYIASPKWDERIEIYVDGELRGEVNKRQRDGFYLPYRFDSDNRCSAIMYRCIDNAGGYKTLTEAKAAFRYEYENLPFAALTQIPKPQIPEVEGGLTSYLVGRMLAMSDWRHVETVLQPLWDENDSVVRTYTECYTSAHGQADCMMWDCVADGTVDAEKLRCTDKRIRVVSDNFKDYARQTGGAYDMVILCPPSKNPAIIAEDWCLAARELMRSRGGQFLCLMDLTLPTAKAGGFSVHRSQPA